jgi:hypothetical protein
MATKQPLKTTFDADRVIRPIFTGGSVAIDNGAQILATTLGEDAVLTNPANGRHLAQIEGVRRSNAGLGNVLAANLLFRMANPSRL